VSVREALIAARNALELVVALSPDPIAKGIAERTLDGLDAIAEGLTPGARYTRAWRARQSGPPKPHGDLTVSHGDVGGQGGSLSSDLKRDPDREGEESARGEPISPNLTVSHGDIMVMPASVSRVRTRRLLTRVPDREHEVEWAKANGIDHTHAYFPEFIDHWRANGEGKADWAATWRNWVRRQPSFQPRLPVGPRGLQPVRNLTPEDEAEQKRRRREEGIRLTWASLRDSATDCGTTSRPAGRARFTARTASATETARSNAATSDQPAGPCAPG
jgi:hypothetical protein